MCYNLNRWIIIHVAFIVLSNAQPEQPESQPGHTAKATVFGVFVAVFFFIGLISVYIRHCSRPIPEYTSNNFLHRRSRRGGLETAVVETFPVFTYSAVKTTKLGTNELECSVCLTEFEDKETVRLLPVCNHLFHLDCIDVWLYSHATCPVCRTDLTVEKKEDDYRNNDDRHVVIEINGKFPRSNSTGHSMGRFSDGFERFTLRLPEDVKRRIVVVSGRRLKRARSFDLEYSVRSGGLLDRFGLFVAKSNSGSVRSHRPV